MEPIETIAEARSELKKLRSCATDTDRFIARCLPLMMYLFQVGKITKKRKPSAWQTFLSVEMKQGKSIQECAKKWKYVKADKMENP